ncbi:MAG: hypothetical protein FWC09_10200 [Lachnospiraceae bacterium]|nr:hypothetical protein [Lachnospiraceae bacterium]
MITQNHTLQGAAIALYASATNTAGIEVYPEVITSGYTPLEGGKWKL